MATLAQIQAGEKKCWSCGQMKPLDDFYWVASRGGRAHNWCKPCSRNKAVEDYKNNREKRVARSREWYAKNRERARATGRIYNEKNKERRRAQASEYQRKHPEKKRARWLRDNYRLSLEEYERMAKEQNNACAICLQPERATRLGKAMFLSVDHDHASGKVRGLLCAKHNKAIGLFQEDPGLLKMAIAYLEKHR